MSDLSTASVELSLTVAVELRAPRLHEWMWWVSDISTPNAALAEVLRESEEIGFPAMRDHEWKADECGQWPVTVEIRRSA